jgi:hypothetical protein
LGLAEPYPLPDSAQVFQGDTGGGACSLGHDLLRDDVVDVGGVPLLFATAVLKPSSGGRGALGLELAAKFELPLAVPVQATSVERRHAVHGGDVDDAEVHAEPAIGVVVDRGFGYLAHGDQVEHAVAFDQIGLALAVFTQRLERVGATNEADVLDTPGGGPDTDGLSVVLPAQAPVVKRVRRLGTEGDRFGLRFGPAFGAVVAEVSGTDVGL